MFRDEHGPGCASVSAFSPNGDWLATGGSSKIEEGVTLRLFNLSKLSAQGLYEPVAQMEHFDGIRSIAFSPDSSILVTGGENRVLRRWSLKDRTELLPRLNTGGIPEDIIFSADADVFITACATPPGEGDILTAWHAHDGDQLTPHYTMPSKIDRVWYSAMDHTWWWCPKASMQVEKRPVAHRFLPPILADARESLLKRASLISGATEDLLGERKPVPHEKLLLLFDNLHRSSSILPVAEERPSGGNLPDGGHKAHGEKSL